MSADPREREWLLQEKYGGVESAAFFDDLKRLEQGEPLAYVIGHIPFLGISIDLSKRPLIPRPETEYWLEHALADLVLTPGLGHMKVLDLFAGSGCIGAAVLKKLPDARVDFGEIDAELLVGIRITLQKNGIDPSRARFFETDIFSGIPSDARYDAIFANPPYISRERRERVGDSVIAYEPHQALFADTDGMALIEKTISHAPAFLAPGGRLCIEHDDFQGEAVRAAFAASGFSNVVTHDDQFGLPRMTSGALGAPS